MDDFDFDLNIWVESWNLAGQSQPSTIPTVSDPSLDHQILNDIQLNLVETEPNAELLLSNEKDEISNALIDLPNAVFDDLPSLDALMVNFSRDQDDFILPSSPSSEMPKRSSIEDTLESMNLDQSFTGSSICVQTGSSPVEPKAIDNFILAGQSHVSSERSTKNRSKIRKTSGYQKSSSTVGPINVLSRSTGCQPYASNNVQMQSHRLLSEQIDDFDQMDGKCIKLLSQPRMKFRPRTQNESQNAAHYIRCGESSQYDYPTVAIPQVWAFQSAENLIEVTLVGIDDEPHAYKINNKNCQDIYTPDALIFRQHQPHTLYFRVTNEDLTSGFKIFQIEFIKCKQDDVITKELIRRRQLEQSKLRFTRIYLNERHEYQRDEISTAFSCVMSEAYADVAVEHFGPRYGAMTGETVYVLLKGRVIKEDLLIEVTEKTTGLYERPNFTKNNNLIYFSMPNISDRHFDRATVNVSIYYKGEPLHQTNYMYNASLDQTLAALNLNDGTATSNSLSSGSLGNNFFAATGACPVLNLSRKSSNVKRPKRLQSN